MFKWKTIFNSDVAAIDEQHQHLFELGAKLHKIVTIKDQGDHYDEIMQVLMELKDYTVEHFRYEENLMVTHGYEYVAPHKVEHDAFIDKVNEVLSKNIDEAQNNISLELIIFLADWIEKHILQTDLSYKEFFKQKGVF